MQHIDDRLVKKVNELVKDGVTSVAEMERHLQSVAKVRGTLNGITFHDRVL